MAEENNINSPLDNGKTSITDYINNIISQEVNKYADFGMPYCTEIPKEVIICEKQRFFMPIMSNTYFFNIVHNNKEKIDYLKTEKVINAVIYNVNSYQHIFNNRTVTPAIATISIVFKTENGELSEEVILDDKAKSSVKDFITAVNKSNNNILVQIKETDFILLKKYINSFSSKKINCFINQGRVNYKEYKGRLYDNAYTENGIIIPANELGVVVFDDCKTGISLDKTRLAANPILYLGEYNVKQEIHKLLLQMSKVYKGRIEPFLCLGAAILCTYIDEIWENCSGFPVIYLHGSTKQGKSLLQGIIANIYGLTNKQIAMGNSTDNAIAMKCHCANATPICINDYDYFQSQGTKFENNVVHLYEQGTKEKLYDGSRFNSMPISSTAIYSSNYMPCDKPKIFNRLLPLYFPNNGIDTAQIDNNFVNDTRRSRILVEIQKYAPNAIIDYIYSVEKYILNLGIFPGKDRESNNVAIAYAGLLLLENISNFKLDNQEALLKEYCQWYQDLIEKTVSPVDNFLNSLSTLYLSGRIRNDIDFKIESKDNRIIFTFDTQECIKEYNNFFASQNEQGISLINSRTFAYDLKASKYFKCRTNVHFKSKGSTSATILDITDSINAEAFFNSVTGHY